MTQKGILCGIGHRVGAAQPHHGPAGRALRAACQSAAVRRAALSGEEGLVKETGFHPIEDTSPLRVVVIGGGTGLSAVLEGLKRCTRPADPGAPAVEITAIVTVADDGGSSGRLRREFDVFPTR